MVWCMSVREGKKDLPISWTWLIAFTGTVDPENPIFLPYSSVTMSNLVAMARSQVAYLSVPLPTLQTLSLT